MSWACVIRDSAATLFRRSALGGSEKTARRQACRILMSAAAPRRMSWSMKAASTFCASCFAGNPRRRSRIGSPATLKARKRFLIGVVIHRTVVVSAGVKIEYGGCTFDVNFSRIRIAQISGLEG
jgi:hypothetical protein